MDLYGVEGVTVHGLVDKYSNEDRDLWTPVTTILHKTIGPASFGFAPKMNRSIKAGIPDIIHQHGLWMYPSVVTSKIAAHGTKTIISLHGMLDEWALNHAAYKKKIAYFLYEGRNLRQGRIVFTLSMSQSIIASGRWA